MNTTVLTITKDPFLPWKRTAQFITEARKRGFPVCAYLDQTGLEPDRDMELLIGLGAEVSTFVGKGYPESALKDALASIKTDWVFWISDDEVPGGPLWKFAAEPPLPYAYRVRLVSILPSGLHYATDQYQPRVFPRVGAGVPEDKFETGLIFDVPEYDALDLIIWHYCNFAPREEREAKVARYMELEKERKWAGYGSVTRQLYLYEDFPVLAQPLPPAYARQLP